MDEQRKATIEETADAIQDALDALDVPAYIWIEGGDSYEPYLSVSVDGVEAYELSEELVTLQDVSAEMQAIAKNYDPQDRRLLHDMEEPYSPEELLFTKRVYDRIADASRAALEIRQGKEPEKVYAAYLERWNQEDRTACQKECKDFLQRMNTLHDRPYEETMDILKDAYQKLNPEKSQDRQNAFPVPGRENHAAIVWVEKAVDGKSHWYDFTEEEALKIDFDKAFPNGYVDYYVDIDKNGIIQSDTMEPLRKGTLFTDSYANFKCPEHSYVKDRMEEVAEAVQDSFRALCVDAHIRIEGRESGEPHFVICTKGIQEDTSYELPGSLDTLFGVASGMEKAYRSYDVNEERKKYKPGRNGLPEEPYLTNELRYIKKVCHRIADACKAAERIGAGEEEDKVYQEYHDAWLKEDVKVSCKPRNVETMKEYLIRGIQDLAKDYQNTFDIPQKDIEKALRRACKELPGLNHEEQKIR